MEPDDRHGSDGLGNVVLGLLAKLDLADAGCAKTRRVLERCAEDACAGAPIARDLQAHLTSCAACRQELDGLVDALSVTLG
jgi:hypothetical protein